MSLNAEAAMGGFSVQMTGDVAVHETEPPESTEDSAAVAIAAQDFRLVCLQAWPPPYHLNQLCPVQQLPIVSA